MCATFLCTVSAVDGERLSHGALDVQSFDLQKLQWGKHRQIHSLRQNSCHWSLEQLGTVWTRDIVPVLLEQGHQEVDGHQAVLPATNGAKNSHHKLLKVQL